MVYHNGDGALPARNTFPTPFPFPSSPGQKGCLDWRAQPQRRCPVSLLRLTSTRTKVGLASPLLGRSPAHERRTGCFWMAPSRLILKLHCRPHVSHFLLPGWSAWRFCDHPSLVVHLDLDGHSSCPRPPPQRMSAVRCSLAQDRFEHACKKIDRLPPGVVHTLGSLRTIHVSPRAAAIRLFCWS